MLKVGDYNTLSVVEIVDFGVYLESDKGSILLPKKYVPEGTVLGTSVEVFIYTDSEDRLVATTLHPLAAVGEIACLEVKEVNHYGAFLEWGLEKDLLLPFKKQIHASEIGDKVVVTVEYDEVSGRPVANARLGNVLDYDPMELSKWGKVSVMVYDVTDLGAKVVVNGAFDGLIYHSDIYKDLSIGDTATGTVKNIRSDGKLDVTLRPVGFKELSGEKNVIIEALEDAGGFLALNSKSSPDEIKARFEMSKKAFKKLIGNLYKERRITIEDDGIRLND